jgi:hypothetical protein
MNIPESFISCGITPHQAQAFKGFCETLRSHYEDQAAIPSGTVESAIRALIELSQCEMSQCDESDPSHQQWRAMRSPATQLAGITVSVRNQLGDDLMLQLDAGGRPHIGTWTLYDEESMPRYLVLFNMIQGGDGWIMRLDNTSETTEILIGETPDDLNWTHQPDYHVEMESDDIDKESLSEISDEIAEEIVENVVPAATNTGGIKDEFPQYSVEPDLQKINRKQDSHIREITNLPPKIPPQRAQRSVERSSTVSQYRQDPPPQPVTPNKTNKLAIISLVTGILSLLSMVLSCLGCWGIITFLFGIAGAVTGYLAKKEIDESDGSQSSRKMAIAGMIMGLAGVVLSIIMIVIVVVFYGGIMAFGEFL